MRPEETQTQQRPSTSTTELSPQDFVKMIGEGGSKKHLAAFMPEIFWEQAASGCSHFIIPSEMIRDRLINIVLEQPLCVNDFQLSTKFRLSGVLDEKFNFIPLTKGGTSSSTKWLSGFRSLSVDLGQNEIHKGFLTKDEINYLKVHAEFFQHVGNEAYSRDRNYTKIRPYLSNVDGKDGEFLFLCEVRVRPLSNDEKLQIATGAAREEDFESQRESIGIILKGWTPGAFKLIGRVSETVSIDSRNGATLETQEVSRGTWSYRRP